MPSWQARWVSAAVRSVIRRRSWGDEQALAKRARIVFATPRVFQWFGVRGLRAERVAEGAVRGEWLVPSCSSRGVLLYLHGGGFVAGSRLTHRPLTGALARLSERRVLSLDYRLAPEHRFPAALDDVIAAYRWILGQGVAPGSLALAGDSAGGGLVLSALHRVRQEGLPLPARAVCFSPWTDLTCSGESLKLNGGMDAMFHRENMADFARAYLGPAALAQDPRASPLLGDFAGLPPLLLQVGSTELLLDDARRVHEKVQRARGQSRLEVVDDVCHAWQLGYHVIPEARASVHQAAAFLSE